MRMKRIRPFLFAVLALSALLPASAQRHQRHQRHAEAYEPTVYMISVHEVDTFMMDCEARQEAALRNRLAAESAIRDHKESWRPGFHQASKPQFIFASKNNRFSLALGGAIELRTSYDFDGIVDNNDFIPADIPMAPNYNTSQQLLMDASASSLFLRAITNTGWGRVMVFVQGDFRGGSPGSYTPHLRSAYVNFAGFTAGRDVTTFCDLSAVAPTVDYRGPNAYNYRYATMLRYEHSFWDEVMSFGLAAELSQPSATYGSYFAPLKQRMPDFPVYVQVAWGKDRMSHLRASAVFRNLYAHNLRTGNNTSLFGWGVQGSGHIRVIPLLDLYMSFVYGEGITPYISDLNGSGLDFIPDPDSPTSLTTPPMYGWQAAARINLVPNCLSLSGGYSTAFVRQKNGILSPEQYREGQYIFGNLFCHVSPRMTVALEYLYGSRENMNGVKNHANRASLMIKYSF